VTDAATSTSSLLSGMIEKSFVWANIDQEKRSAVLIKHTIMLLCRVMVSGKE
jgi:hypothetical protein